MLVQVLAVTGSFHVTFKAYFLMTRSFHFRQPALNQVVFVLFLFFLMSLNCDHPEKLDHQSAGWTYLQYFKQFLLPCLC